MKKCDHPGAWADMPCPDPSCGVKGEELIMLILLADGARETQKFINYWQARPGSGRPGG